MQTPDVILRYFTAANAGLSDEACDCFSRFATVEDEGARFTGSEAIRGWIEATALKYQPQVDVLGSAETDGAIIVSGRVSGNFPGSPAELDYQFTLLGQTLISHLSIQ